MKYLMLVVLAACASSGTQQASPSDLPRNTVVSTTPIPGGRRVSETGAWLTYDRIPGRWEHLFRGEVTGPYYLAFSEGLACRVNGDVYTHLQAGHYLACPWRTPRG